MHYKPTFSFLLLAGAGGQATALSLKIVPPSLSTSSTTRATVVPSHPMATSTSRRNFVSSAGVLAGIVASGIAVPPEQQVVRAAEPTSPKSVVDNNKKRATTASGSTDDNEDEEARKKRKKAEKEAARIAADTKQRLAGGRIGTI